MEITPQTLIADILKKYPAAAKVLKRYKMNCASCMGVSGETVRSGCANHGIDMRAFTADLNKAIK